MMVGTQEMKEFFSENTSMYLFLSQIFFKELSEETIEQLAGTEYPCETGNKKLDQGYQMVRRYFKFARNDIRTQLACEYARIFLNAGMYTEARETATPYESVFTSDERLIMQDSRDDVYRHFLEDGFKVNPDLHEPEDHIAFELEYLSVMNERAIALLDAGEWNELARNIERQQEFIKQHLLNWLPDLRDVAQQYAQVTFYLGMMLITEGYLQESDTALDEVRATITELSEAAA